MPIGPIRIPSPPIKPEPPIWESWKNSGNNDNPFAKLKPRPKLKPSEYGSFMDTPGYNAGQAAHIKSKPDLDTDTTTVKRGSEDNKVKVVNPSNYLENLNLTDPDYAAESKVEFNNLTTIEILEVSRSGNMRVDSRNLNPNILDIVNIVNTFAPTEIIKLQKTSEEYFSPFQENLETNMLEITTIPGIAEVTIPQQNDNNILKAQVQILAPKRIHRDTIYI